MTKEQRKQIVRNHDPVEGARWRCCETAIQGYYCWWLEAEAYIDKITFITSILEHDYIQDDQAIEKAHHKLSKRIKYHQRAKLPIGRKEVCYVN